MTKEFIELLNRALALVAIGCGGLGMMMCVPFFFVNNWTVLSATALVFTAGAVLYGSGAISMAILLRK